MCLWLSVSGGRRFLFVFRECCLQQKMHCKLVNRTSVMRLTRLEVKC